LYVPDVQNFLRRLFFHRQCASGICVAEKKHMNFAPVIGEHFVEAESARLAWELEQEPGRVPSLSFIVRLSGIDFLYAVPEPHTDGHDGAVRQCNRLAEDIC
jgi:hypothetical protein